jgi:hypothetical protein
MLKNFVDEFLMGQEKEKNKNCIKNDTSIFFYLKKFLKKYSILVQDNEVIYISVKSFPLGIKIIHLIGILIQDKIEKK